MKVTKKCVEFRGGCSGAESGGKGLEVGANRSERRWGWAQLGRNNWREEVLWNEPLECVAEFVEEVLRGGGGVVARV